MPENLTAVSLFAGVLVGGFDLALQRAGVTVVAAVEIDPAARGVLADRFPETTLFTDVRSVTADAIRAAGFVPEQGIITAGFPCQDLSVAGRRGGLGEGTRSGLFWEIVRLVAALRPAWIVIENVPGLLSATCPCPGTGQHDGCTEPHPILGGGCAGGCFPAHGGAMGLVLGVLADLGYGFAYRVLDAQFWGVPQRRRRVFIVGRAGADARGPVQVLLEPDSSGRNPAAGGATGQDVAGTLGSRVGGGRTTDLDGHGAYIVDSLTTSSVGGTGGPDVKAAQAGHLIASAITAREGKGPDSDATTTLLPISIQDGRRTDKTQNGSGISEPGGPAYTLDTTGAQAIAFDCAQITSADNRSNPRPGSPAPTLSSTGDPHIASPLTAGQSSAGVSRPGRRGEDGVNCVTHALTAEGHDASEDGTGRGTPLVPVSLAVAGEFSTGEDVAQTIRAAKGQPGTVAIPIALRGWSEGNPIEAGKPGDPAFTILTPGGGSSYPMVATPVDLRNATRHDGATGAGTPGTGVGQEGDPAGALATEARQAVALPAAVRRLTPLECERLQGFPPVLTWSDDMTRDEFAAALLAAGHVRVDIETGSVWVLRGPGGAACEPRWVEGSDVNGYLATTFRLAGMRRQIRLHRLIWIAARGTPPKGMAVCHRDDDKKNNRIDNLYLASPEQNSSDAAASGRYRTGENNPSSKLTIAERRQIADDYRQSGCLMRELAERYGITKQRVSQIVREDGWTATSDGRPQSDAARYRQLGNAVAVPVVEWIVRRTVAAHHMEETR